MPGKMTGCNVDLRFTDGSEINNHFAARIYGPSEIIPMGSLSGVFLSQEMAILRCAQLLAFKNVPRRRIHIFSDRMVATVKLAKTTTKSAFICEHMQAVEKK